MKLIITYLILIFILPSVGGIGKIFSQPQVHEEWVARYPGPSNDFYGPFLAVDKNGNSYLVGTHVIDSVYLSCVKYDTYGNQQWATLYKYPGEGYFVPTGLALDSSGNAYVISEREPSDYYPTQGLIAKFNSSNGSLVWAKRYVGEYGWSSFSDVKIDRLNNIYVSGWSDSSHLVIRYNTNGDSVWVRKYHPPPVPPLYPSEVFNACTLDDSLNIIFTGMRIDYYPPYGAYDSLLVAKYSPSGVLKWEATYSNSINGPVGIKIVADQTGNSYIGAQAAVSGNGVYLTLKYDRNGAQQWAKIYQGTGGGDDNLHGIALDRINNVLYITGNARNQMATTIKYNPSTGDSIWVRKDTGSFSNSSSFDINIDSSGSIYITGSSYNIPPTNGEIMTIKFNSDGTKVWLIKYSGQGRSLNLCLDNLRNVYICGYFEGDYIVIKYSQLNEVVKRLNKIPK